MSGWWEGFFSGLWEEVQLTLWTDDDNHAAADNVERALQLPERATVLDVPCGEGRISIELAARGHEVTGIDLNETFLAAAARKAAERDVMVEWQQRDMRDLPFDAEFDAALNFGGSFGYFHEDDQNARAAAAAHRALRPGGRFLIDLPTAETIFPRFRDRLWRRAGDLLVLSENRYVEKTGRAETDWTVVAPDGRREQRHSSIRLYTYRELVALLTDAGFTGVEGFDAGDLTPFHLGASRLMVVATK